MGAAIDANVRAADTAVVDADQGLALLGNGLFHFTDSHLFRAFIDESFHNEFPPFGVPIYGTMFRKYILTRRNRDSQYRTKEKDIYGLYPACTLLTIG